MARFTVSHDSALEPAAAWDRVTDWARHGAFVPLTTTTVTTAAPAGVGTSFLARTGLGRVGFDDPMQVVVWDPPRRCRLEKQGRVMLGWAELTVAPLGAGSTVTWTEDIRLAGLPRLLDAPTAATSRRLFARVLAKLLAE